MDKNDIKVGQLWKSKYSFPHVGYYTVEILKVGEQIVETKFTASEWEDGHWNDNYTMTIYNLLENYDLL